MSRFLTDLGASGAFRLGLILGGIGTVAGCLAWGLVRRGRTAPVGGALVAAAALGALNAEFPLPPAVPIGAAALLVAGMVGRGIWVRGLVALPGSYLVVALGELRGDPPVVLLTIAVALGAALATDFDAGGRDRGIGMPLLAISMIGVLITVPDTERAMALAGAALPFVLLGPPLRLVSLGPGAAAVVGVIGWVAGMAWSGRPGATVGALASLGLMAAEPIGRRLSRDGRNVLGSLLRTPMSGTLSIVALHGALVLGTSRIAGLLRDPIPALGVAAIVLAVGVILASVPARGVAAPTDPEGR